MTSKKIEIEIETETEKDKNLKNNHVRSLTRTNTRKNPLGIIPQMTVILLPHRRIHLTKGKRAKEATQKEVQKIKRKESVEVPVADTAEHPLKGIMGSNPAPVRNPNASSKADKCR